MKDLKSVSTLFYSSYTPIAYLAALSAQLHLKQVLHSICIKKKRTKNLWGWSAVSLIGGSQSFMTSMRRSSQDNFCGKNSQKSNKYSQSYDVVCQLALLGGKGLRKKIPVEKQDRLKGKSLINNDPSIKANSVNAAIQL